LPLQALTVRTQGDLRKRQGEREEEVPADPKLAAEFKKELQGAFVVKDGKAVFVEVTTGITGTTEIEVLSGLKPGDEVIIGPYRSLRTVRNETRVEVDNKKPGVATGS